MDSAILVSGLEFVQVIFGRGYTSRGNSTITGVLILNKSKHENAKVQIEIKIVEIATRL